jgi:predicted ATPase
MYISRFQINDYKGFYISHQLKLRPGINIIVGRNNVGKSALLEALSLRFPNVHYKSSKLERSPRDEAQARSWANISLTLDRRELLYHLPQLQQPLCVPLPPMEEYISQSSISEREHQRRYLEEQVFGKRSFTIDFCIITASEPSDLRHQISMEVAQDISLRFPAIHYYNGNGSKQTRTFIHCDFGLNGRFEIGGTQEGDNESLDFGIHLARRLLTRIYMFRAERMDVHKCPLVYDRELRANASNLAAVLHLLNPGLIDRINHFLRLIFPQIHQVFTRMVGGTTQQEVEIFVNEIDSTSERDVISLKDSGTGLIQVLAILYLVVRAEDDPSILIIDEPQSFLHPGAARMLIEILSLHPQHQYIIATHSPALISAAEPATLTLVTKEKGQPTRAEAIDTEDLEQINLCLLETGTRLSDVFGYDKVIWVEGDTERECFPMILRTILGRRLLGTAVIAVHNPSDLVEDHKDAQRIIGIHKRLSEGKGLLPPAIGFLFDRECRTQEQIEKLLVNFEGAFVRRDRVKFLRRRMYENYLLHAGAIAAVLKELGKPPTKPKISQQIEQAMGNSAFKEWVKDKPGGKSSAATEQWLERKPRDYFRDVPKNAGKTLETIHAADVLGDIFAEAGLFYRKVEDGVLLTRWLLKNDPDHLREIADLLGELLPSETQTGDAVKNQSLSPNKGAPETGPWQRSLQK